MSFVSTFSQHFDHKPPFDIPPGAEDRGTVVTTDGAKTQDDLFGPNGAATFSALPAGPFLCSAIVGEPPTVTFFLMIIDGERYFYFKEQVRDVFNAAASPEKCFAALERMVGIFAKRPETSFKLTYDLGAVKVDKGGS